MNQIDPLETLCKCLAGIGIDIPSAVVDLPIDERRRKLLFILTQHLKEMLEDGSTAIKHKSTCPDKW
jgi:hypothetical protein